MNPMEGADDPGFPAGAMPTSSLADVLPAVAAGFGLGAGGPLHIPVSRDAVILLVDGLGAELLATHARSAPTLWQLTSASIRAGFPATTATSLTSLSVGAPCGVHGIVGYSFRPVGGGRVLNSLRWTLDVADGETALHTYQPEDIQQHMSFPQRFARAGVEVHYVTPGYQRDSALTRAVFRERGAHHPASMLPDIRAAVAAIASRSGSTRRFTYAYYGDLDLQGHLHGPGSEPWLEQLTAVDTMVADLIADLPSTCTLVVTGDHGMVPAGERIDIDTHPGLLGGVDAVAGEARVRHVYAAPGAQTAVAAAWATILGDRAFVVSRDQAIDDGWFGPRVDGAIASRIGDVVAVARGHTVLTRSLTEPMESAMAGHHGAWTAAEQLVPLLISHRD